MKKLKELSFENIVTKNTLSSTFGEGTEISVLAKDNNLLAKATCKEFLLNDFAKNMFYPELLKREINYFYLEVFGDKERIKTENMPLDNFIKYVNVEYGEDEVTTLNYLYEIYNSLNNYTSNNALNQNSKCICIYDICSIYEKTGAGTLIVDYLKENYDMIFLYSMCSAQSYWVDKVDFKEILNGFMFWTTNTKLNEILCGI